GAMHCATNFMDLRSENAQQINNSSPTVGNLPNGESYYEGDVLNLSGGNFTGRKVLYVSGDVVINSNIEYNTSPWGSVENIPNFTLVVDGNIFINRNVTQLDGLYVAQG